jgi:hypothetical protein
VECITYVWKREALAEGLSGSSPGAEQQGWIRTQCRESEGSRQANFYSLTAAGRSQLEHEKQSWSLSTATNPVGEWDAVLKTAFP